MAQEPPKSTPSNGNPKTSSGSAAKGNSLTDMDAPEKESQWFNVVIRKLGLTLFSGHGITISIGILLFVLITSVLSIDFFTVSHIAENEIAKQNIFAPYDLEVVDEDATQLRRDQARDNVLPIFHSEQEINTRIQENLKKQLTELNPIFMDETLDEETRERRFFELLGQNPETELVYLAFLADATIPKPALWWNRMKTTSRVTLERILKEGITGQEIAKRKDDIIEEQIPKSKLRSEEITLIRYIISNILLANRVEDEMATAKAREEAIAAVEPVIKIFQQGEKIVGTGERITPIHLAALNKMGKSTQGVSWLSIVGMGIVAGLFVTVLWIYLYNFEARKYFKPSYAGMIATMTFVTMVSLKLLTDIQDLQPVIFPLATFAFTLTLFTNARIGIMATALLVLVLSLAVKLDFSALAVLLLGSVVGVFVLSRHTSFTDRFPLVLAGVACALTNMVLIIGTFFLNHPEQLTIPWNDLVFQMLLGATSGGLSVIISLGLLPFLEFVFQLITPYTLVELGNHNKPLLKKLQMKAPGTFHHSLLVASLAEEAALNVGADPLLTRVGALYHDIGKMKRPIFFIENQGYYGVENPHDKLPPRLSKMVVTAHPRDSLEMARRYRLPQVIQKFMTEHHGTMVAGFFYHQACQQEGAENVNKAQFRYAGPKPNIKETAIVMLADACESACRALKNPTVKDIETRIDKIIQQRIDDHQFDDCPLTFKDINTIRQTFVRVLRGQQHNRIEYQQSVKEFKRIPPTGSGSSDASKQLNEQIQVMQQAASADSNGAPGIPGANSPSVPKTLEDNPTSPRWDL